jgi:hypothetical protein
VKVIEGFQAANYLTESGRLAPQLPYPLPRIKNPPVRDAWRVFSCFALML